MVPPYRRASHHGRAYPLPLLSLRIPTRGRGEVPPSPFGFGFVVATLLACTLDSLVRVSRRVGRSRCVKRPERAEVRPRPPAPRGGGARFLGLLLGRKRGGGEPSRAVRARRLFKGLAAPPSREPLPAPPTDADPPGRRVRPPPRTVLSEGPSRGSPGGNPSADP